MPDTDPYAIPHRGLITLCIMLVTIMQVLDTTIANVALPHIQGNLSASRDQIVWVLTSYIVASAIMTLPSGWLAGRFGRKRIFVTAVIGFTGASLMCGLAMSLPQLVLFRILQGCFGACVVPLAQATMLDINPPEKRGGAMALWGVGVMVGPILGPTLGGWLTENYDWRWVFFINLPIGIIALTGILLFMPDSERQDRRFDGFGFFMLALAIGSIQLILDRGEQLDWFDSGEIVLYCCLIGASLWMYLVHTRQVEHPFITADIFRDRNLATSMIFIFFTGIILLATMALLPPYLQNLMGYPVLDVGLVMAPRGMGTMVSMLLVGRLVNSVDPRLLILSGLGFTIASLYFMTRFTLYVPPSMLVWTGALQGFGLGFIFIPLNTIAYSTLAPRYRAEAASIFSLVRNMGSAIGMSLVMAVLSRNILINSAYLSDFITPSMLHLDWQMVPQSMMTAGTGLAAMVEMEINRQAAAIAYVNDFKMMMWIMVAVVPLVSLLRVPPRQLSAATTG